MNTIRVGTWNVLLQGDEFEPDYGTPLQIAVCSDQVECTRARHERVWDVLEDRAPTLDVMLLSEADDSFKALQNNSKWTLVHESGDCALYISKFSIFSVVTTFSTMLNDLSGCPSVPMAILCPATIIDGSSASFFIVGSVHVKASVENMTDWYASAAPIILETTGSVVHNITSGIASVSSSDRYPIPPPIIVDTNGSVVPSGMTHFLSSSLLSMSFILGGDFNKNLTETIMPDSRWNIVYAKNNADVLYHGTSQKEYNWMGSFDGFWVTVPLEFTVGNNNFEDYYNDAFWAPYHPESTMLQTSDTVAHLNGFMPKVVQGLLQGGIVQSVSQFAVLYGVNDSVIPADQILQWATNSKDDLRLAYSASSTFDGSGETIDIPMSNPLTEVLSDHMMVTSTFTVTLSAGGANNEASSNSSSHNGLLAPFAVIVGLEVLAFVWRKFVRN